MKIEQVAFLNAFFDPATQNINQNSTSTGEVRISQFAALWRSARFQSNRRVDSGLPSTEGASWLGQGEGQSNFVNLEIERSYVSCLLYLVLLDQLSAILKGSIDLKKTSDNENGIKTILLWAKGLGIHNLGNEEINGIVTLRHTLAHNFSLGSDPDQCKPRPKTTVNAKEKLCFRYELDHWTLDEKDKLFSIKAGTFRGSYKSKANETEVTKVNVQGLINLIEEIVKRIIEEEKTSVSPYKGVIDIDELNGRFTTLQWYK